MIASSHLVVLFGLASAASYGAGDFMGGYLTRRANGWKVLVISYVGALSFLILLALLTSEPLPSPTALGWGYRGWALRHISVGSILSCAGHGENEYCCSSHGSTHRQRPSTLRCCHPGITDAIPDCGIPSSYGRAVANFTT